MNKDVITATENQAYKYKFTLICAVYNVEEYVEETLQSFIAQDIGFEENVQVVLVNDGSKDASGEICDKYAAMYPNNIRVIHKENGGVSSARNIGLANIEGKYYNFCDPDDLLTPNTLSSVWNFFEEHEDEIDIATIPMHFFEAYTGVPYHNSKFDKGTRVINLVEEPYAPLFSSSSSFIHSRVKGMFTFDTRLKFAEDSKYVQHILLEKLALGVVADCKYMYRRRVANTSAINSSQNRDDWYFDTLEYSFLETIEYAKKKYGTAPEFLQHTFLCDFKWRITQSRKDNKYIDTDPAKYNAYFKLLTKCINEIDVDVIMTNKFYNDTLKLFILKDVQKKKLTVKNLRGVDCYFYGNRWLFDMSRLCVAEPCMFEPTKKGADLYFTIDCPADVDNYRYFVDIGKKRVYASEVKNDMQYNLHLPSHVKKYFKVTIPLQKDDVYFSFGMAKNKESRTSLLEVNRFGKFFPINTVETSYFPFGKWTLKKASNNVFVIKRSSRLRKLIYELKYSKDLMKLKNPKGYKVVAYRWFYFIGKMLHVKPRWLLMDRINKADDNAEALFDYLCKHKKKDVKARFVVADGDEFKRLKSEYKHVTVYNSRRHYLDYIMSDRIISSHVDDFVMRPLSWKQVYIKDITAKKKFIFLQHGVTQNDISQYLNKFSKNIFGVTVVSKVERDLFRSSKFAYKDSNIWLDGFARFDRLYDASAKKITVMPTWRSYLAVGMNSETGVWTLVNDFKDSDFFNFYNDLLNDERLINAAEKHGYKIQFMPHPILAPHVDLFDKNDSVVFMDGMNSYRDVYAESDLILTDYSSAVFDFAYLRKPVVYAQFDREQMLRRATTYSLNCDFYDTYGFGEITPDYETTVNTLIEYIEGGCELKDKYRERIDSFFAFNDRSNCERITKKILETK